MMDRLELGILGWLFVALAIGGPATATDVVKGQVTTFASPGGVEERCIRINPMPGAIYSSHDLKTEADYCEIDLYSPSLALCPKTWSTSPGMIIYNISTGPYAGNRSVFERQACPEGKSAASLAKGEIAKFKPTMNAKGTSGTFSASPLLYYHMSRFLDADLGVPPAVWRSMDRQSHLSDVARPGLALSGNRHSSGMNHAGWQVLVAADQEPTSYSPESDLFTADGKAIYGILTDSPGSRYNSEVNGTRKSGWGKGQSLDFQQTAPFLALRSPGPLADAIRQGIAASIKDPQIRKDMGDDADPRQVAYWMRDVASIALLDFIFSQQDRIGNIDYVVEWMWIENGKLKQKKAETHGGEPPHDGALRIKRTRLNDNDAGARVEYANFAKSTGMLNGLRHFPARTYQQLMVLNSDLKAQGALFTYLRDSFGLDARQLDQIVRNTGLAAEILRQACHDGSLSFDLDPEEFFLTGATSPSPIECGED